FPGPALNTSHRLGYRSARTPLLAEYFGARFHSDTVAAVHSCGHTGVAGSLRPSDDLPLKVAVGSYVSGASQRFGAAVDSDVHSGSRRKIRTTDFDGGYPRVRRQIVCCRYFNGWGTVCHGSILQ